NSEKLFADGGKMRKELNFQSGTDAGSSLKLNLNDVIAELTESVTKPGTAITADASGTPAQKELARLNQVTADALREKELAKKAKTDLGAVQAGANATANIDIPEYKDANGQTVLGKRIASGATVSAGDIAQIDAAVTALTQVHTDADKASTDYANNNLVGGGVMNMRLADKDLAMEADKKLSEVIDAYGAFRATLGANQNRLQSSSNNLDNMISNTAQALGSIKDTDFADEMKNHAQSEMLMQSSVMMLKKANAATQLISTLLQG
ncbi:flagellin, partial [Yersinia pseudotuberculosis]